MCAEQNEEYTQESERELTRSEEQFREVIEFVFSDIFDLILSLLPERDEKLEMLVGYFETDVQTDKLTQRGLKEYMNSLPNVDDEESLYPERVLRTIRMLQDAIQIVLELKIYPDG
jgi:hypothetical protein